VLQGTQYGVIAAPHGYVFAYRFPPGSANLDSSQTKHIFFSDTFTPHAQTRPGLRGLLLYVLVDAVQNSKHVLPSTWPPTPLDKKWTTTAHQAAMRIQWPAARKRSLRSSGRVVHGGDDDHGGDDEGGGDDQPPKRRKLTPHPSEGAATESSSGISSKKHARCASSFDLAHGYHVQCLQSIGYDFICSDFSLWHQATMSNHLQLGPKRQHCYQVFVSWHGIFTLCMLGKAQAHARGQRRSSLVMAEKCLLWMPPAFCQSAL
jgi:hypothetical protein